MERFPTGFWRRKRDFRLLGVRGCIAGNNQKTRRKDLAFRRYVDQLQGKMKAHLQERLTSLGCERLPAAVFDSMLSELTAKEQERKAAVIGRRVTPRWIARHFSAVLSARQTPENRVAEESQENAGSGADSGSIEGEIPQSGVLS